MNEKTTLNKRDSFDVTKFNINLYAKNSGSIKYEFQGSDLININNIEKKEISKFTYSYIAI